MHTFTHILVNLNCVVVRLRAMARGRSIAVFLLHLVLLCTSGVVSAKRKSLPDRAASTKQQQQQQQQRGGGGGGTKVRWIPGDNSGEAASAPRSQREWDRRGIKRPDYAKTDLEVWEERLQAAGWTKVKRRRAALVFIGSVGVLLYVCCRRMMSKRRTSSQEAVRNFDSSAATPVDAREARLRRFDNETIAESDDGSGASERKMSYSEIMEATLRTKATKAKAA